MTKSIVSNSTPKSSTKINHSGAGSSNSCSNQGNFSQRCSTSQSASVEFDDEDSCQEVTLPKEIICISDSDESEESNLKMEASSDVDELCYCSICKEFKCNNHDCSLTNENVSTCLVPNCNIVFRAIRDFTPHYRQHIGMPSGVMLCRICYQENRKTERDVNGDHLHHSTENLFKCYLCNIKFNNMAKFAIHKLKTHNSRLINSAGNYLCFYCEKSSPDMMKINEHIKNCRRNQKDQYAEESDSEDEVIVNQSNETSLFDDKSNVKKEYYEPKNTEPKNTEPKNTEPKNTEPLNNSVVQRASKHLLFTCLKPHCNLIFQSFQLFKAHYREHFHIGNTLMCWQCCRPFDSLNALRMHQGKGPCRTPGMFKCHVCFEEYDNLQSLSIHKYTIHNCEVICNKKTMTCPFCKVLYNINIYKKHLIECSPKSNKKVTQPKVKPKPKSKLNKTAIFSGKCVDCGKICLTRAALANHIKIHEYPATKKVMKRMVVNKAVNNEEVPKPINVGDNEETDEVMNPSSSVSLNNTAVDNSESKNFDMYLFENDSYSCLKCPKKFASKSGLIGHWAYCSKVGSKPNLNKVLSDKYYCTNCKENFTRMGFSDHMRLVHGKRLAFNRHKRFCCSACNSKFAYKIALVMHKEHAHGIPGSSEGIKPINTAGECIVVMPIISQATSLANYNAATSEEENSNDLHAPIDINEDDNQNMELMDVSELPENENKFNTSNNVDEQGIHNNNGENIKDNIDEHTEQCVTEDNTESKDNDTVLDEQLHGKSNDCEMSMEDHLNDESNDCEITAEDQLHDESNDCEMPLEDQLQDGVIVITESDNEVEVDNPVEESDKDDDENVTLVVNNVIDVIEKDSLSCVVNVAVNDSQNTNIAVNENEET